MNINEQLETLPNEGLILVPADLLKKFITSIQHGFQELRSKETAYYVDKEFIPLKEAKEMVDLAEYTMYKHVREKTIPYYKRGGRLYFSKTLLENWMQGDNSHNGDNSKSQ